jgi:DNA-binding NtrC family response regulator
MFLLAISVGYFRALRRGGDCGVDFLQDLADYQSFLTVMYYLSLMENSSNTTGYLDFKKTWPVNRRLVVDHCEGIYCGKLYRDSKWNAALAAKQAGISREKFYEKLRKHGHKKPKKKRDL